MECRPDARERTGTERISAGEPGRRENIPSRVWGLSGSALKWIAIVTMFIDHLGGSLFEIYVLNGFGTAPYQGFWDLPDFWIDNLLLLDRYLRMVGRIAFPIFCFLLVEGFCHTRNIRKYALRLGIFCLVSEVPFDLAFRGLPFYWQYQNVFFTLLLGLLGIWALEYFKGPKRIFGILTAVAAAVLADILHTDYGAFGVAFIEVLYLFRGRRALCTAAGVVCLFLYGGIEFIGALAFLPIHFYNGTRGRQPKYFFYVFYPVHLLALAAVGRIVIPYLLG